MNRDQAAEATKATFELAEKIAPLIDGEVEPLTEHWERSYSPISVTVRLHKLIHGYTPRISLRVFERKPSHMRINGLPPQPPQTWLYWTSHQFGDANRSITASRMRPIESIAKQIKSKMLPTYLQVFENVATDFRNHILDQKKKDAQLILLRQATGRDLDKDLKRSTARCLNMNNPQAEFSAVCNGDRVSVSWTCDVGTAVTLARMFMGHKGTLKSTEEQEADDDGE